jgi:hypothetical protein
MANRLKWLRIKSFSCPPVVSNPEQTVLPWQDQPLEQFRDWNGHLADAKLSLAAGDLRSLVSRIKN